MVFRLLAPIGCLDGGGCGRNTGTWLLTFKFITPLALVLCFLAALQLSSSRVLCFCVTLRFFGRLIAHIIRHFSDQSAKKQGLKFQAEGGFESKISL